MNSAYIWRAFVYARIKAKIAYSDYQIRNIYIYIYIYIYMSNVYMHAHKTTHRENPRNK